MKSCFPALCFLALSAPCADGQVPAAAPAQASGSFMVIVTTEFEGSNVFSIVSSDDLKALKRNLPLENEAARKAYYKVRKAWHEKYDPAPPPTAAGRAAAVGPRIIPPFPIESAPVKEVKRIETCPTESAANERLIFHQNRQAELELKAVAEPRGTAVSPPIAIGPGLGATQKRMEKPRPRTIAPKEKAEVMKQFMDELNKLLAGVPADQRQSKTVKKTTLGGPPSQNIGPKKTGLGGPFGK